MLIFTTQLHKCQNVATIQYLYVRITLMMSLVLMMIGKDMVRIWNGILDTIAIGMKIHLFLKVRNLSLST